MYILMSECDINFNNWSQCSILIIMSIPPTDLSSSILHSHAAIAVVLGKAYNIVFNIDITCGYVHQVLCGYVISFLFGSNFCSPLTTVL